MATKISIKTTVPAKPTGVWTYVVDFIEESWRITLRTASSQRWNYSEGDECGADGDLLSSLDRSKCICPTAPAGSIIGKFGGSTADTANFTPFAVGHFCVIEATDKQRGPLFLTINDELTGLANNTGELEVTIEIEMIKSQEEIKKPDVV